MFVNNIKMQQNAMITKLLQYEYAFYIKKMPFIYFPTVVSFIKGNNPSNSTSISLSKTCFYYTPPLLLLKFYVNKILTEICICNNRNM